MESYSSYCLGESRDLIGEEFSSALGVVIRDITELESRITYGFGCSILDKFNDKVQEICDTLQFSLYTRRRNKFNKLALSHGDNTSLGDMVSVDAEKHQPTESQVGLKNKKTDEARDFSLTFSAG